MVKANRKKFGGDASKGPLEVIPHGAGLKGYGIAEQDEAAYYTVVLETEPPEKSEEEDSPKLPMAR